MQAYEEYNSKTSFVTLCSVLHVLITFFPYQMGNSSLPVSNVCLSHEYIQIYWTFLFVDCQEDGSSLAVLSS